MQSLADILKEKTFRNAQLEELWVYYCGNAEELKSCVFPRPKYLTEVKYKTLMAYFVFMNLAKPSVNRLVSGVYGGAVVRHIEDGSPEKKAVDGFLAESNGYSLFCRDWFKSAVLFGTGILAFQIQDKQVVPWLPNPLRTEIITSPTDVRDILAIVEKVGDGDKAFYRYVTKEGWGSANHQFVLNDDFVPHGLGIVPAVLCYGENQLMFGKVRGASLVSSSVDFSKVITKLLLNQAALILNFVVPKAVIKGQLLNKDTEDASDPDTAYELPEGGDFMFVTPNTNFQDLTSTIEALMANYCISQGIPLDALDPSNIPENQSATSARLRNQPLSVTISRLVEEQTTAETIALTIVGALYQFIRTGKKVTWSDFRRRFHATVSIEPSGSPESFAEEVSACIQLLNAKVYNLEDLIRRFHKKADESEILRRIEAAKELAVDSANTGADAPKTQDTVDAGPVKEEAA